MPLVFLTTYFFPRRFAVFRLAFLATRFFLVVFRFPAFSRVAVPPRPAAWYLVPRRCPVVLSFFASSSFRMGSRKSLEVRRRERAIWVMP